MKLRVAAAPVLSLIFLSSPLQAATSFEPDRGDSIVYPDHANGLLNERPFLHATRVEPGSIKLDGRLDDSVWEEIATGWGFVEHEPQRGEPASESTVFRVAYDDEALYFAVACFEKDPSKTASTLCRRDQLENTDMVSIYIDPYHDRTTGYNFRVNPDGVQADHYIFNDGNRDPDWNAVWQSETSSDELGWYTEVKIPFSAVRYRPQEEMTWGLQVYRWMHGRGEDTGWAHWDRNVAGFVSRWGELRGLRDVPAAQQLEITPYFVMRSTDPSIEGPGDEFNQFENFGADIKYGVTADLTLNATFQPDFGQVEADPAVLNLGPFETFFEEKRPFFVDGAQSFRHPEFNLFYSRRIGQGDENTRIRFASKLNGKVGGDVSVAGLLATTDQATPGRAHNPFESGSNQTWYALGRVGKEFNEGNHRVNLMQTAVLRNAGLRTDIDANSRLSRDAYSSGGDFELNFKERSYRIDGGVVATVIDDAPLANGGAVDHDPVVGTGGSLSIAKLAGKWRAGSGGRWEGDKLDPNDMGLLFAADEYSSYAWAQRRLGNDDGGYIVNGNVNLNFNRSWLFASRSVADPNDPSRELFGYGKGRPQALGMNIIGWMENRHRWQTWWGIWHDREGISKYQTRFFAGERGPLVVTPQATGMWLGLGSDWRKNFSISADINLSGNTEGGSSLSTSGSVRWVQNSRLNHRLSVGYSQDDDDAQWVGNFAAASGQPSIGGASYIFGALESNTFDITLRSNLLFSRTQSLEIYAQPFLAAGSYSNARALARPTSYDLRSVDAVLEDDSEVSYDITRNDFRLASVNLNVVYRWEYLPGSAFFLVWTHSRDGSLSRASALEQGKSFSSELDSGALFSNEPENTILAKLSYWFSI